MKYWNQSWGIRVLLALWMLCLMGWSSTAIALTGPSVNAMPSGDTAQSAYTWVGNSLDVWGNVKWGDSTAGTYVWNFGDGSPVAVGAVTNAKNISVNHAYAAAGTYDATLTVTDGNNLSDSATVRIYVKPVVDKDARIQLAIERGLKYLYLSQNSNGSIYSYDYYSSAGAETSAAVLAFENRGHKPVTKDQNGDGVVNAADRAIWEKGRIYANTVHRGLDYLISTLTAVGVAAQYDSNSNGVYVADNYYPYAGYRGPYKIGMYMMALVGAGDRFSGAPELVATTGPAGVIGKTYRTLVEDMVDYADYAQYPGYGGWRYGPQEWPDNSACQWPAIGMEAAEFGWGVAIHPKIKTENFNWIDYSQYFTGYEGQWYYGALGYTGKGTGAALTASGICQMSFEGKVKTFDRIVAAGNYLGTQEHGTGNMYNMYAVAKGARIAKIDTNGDGIGDTYSEIQLLGGWDWYDEYSTYLLSIQNADGSFYLTYYYTFDTAWAVEILTRNVFTLRPIAVMTASPNPTPALSPVKFDIGGSYHQDPAKSLTKWWIDVNGDGVNELSGNFPVSGPITYAGYPEKSPPATYTVNAKLTVGDNTPAPNQEFGEVIVPVTISTNWVPPVANAGGPYNGVVGSPITFTGAASYSPNPGGSIVRYEWDLDGNGTFETDAGASPTVQKTWSTPYAGLIGLRVTDNNGLTTTTQTYTQVFVVDLWPENYRKVSERRINAFVYEYTYKFDMRNRGNATANNVKMTMDSWPANMTVVDGVASFGTIPGGNVKTSLDTFTIRIDRRIVVHDNQIRWKLEYDDIGGTHWTMINFPLR